MTPQPGEVWKHSSGLTVRVLETGCCARKLKGETYCEVLDRHPSAHPNYPVGHRDHWCLHTHYGWKLETSAGESLASVWVDF